VFSRIAANVVFNSTDTTNEITILSKDETLRLSAGLELATVTDNKYQAGSGLIPGNIPLELKENELMNFTTPIFICPNGVGHWQNMEYDPSLVALFNPIANSEEPAAPKKGKLSQGAIVGISFGVIIFIGAVVATLAILSLKVPAFKKIIRPFSARKHGQVTAQSISPSSPAAPHSGWAKANVPAQ
jgi:hypothetical protein